VTSLLIDTSVLIKWFHSDGENELKEARALRSAHVAGELDAHMLDLELYEVGNVLTRALQWTAIDVVELIGDLYAILGPPLIMSATWLRRAATLARIHTLSFYDAGWAAAAVELGIRLISAQYPDVNAHRILTN
jgi:predicted nucleic acid-binding protein